MSSSALKPVDFSEVSLQPLKIIDSHAHLIANDFVNDLDLVLSRAFKHGLHSIISIGSGYGVNRLQETLSLSERFESVVSTLGIHPHEAAVVGNPTIFSDHLHRISELVAANKKVVAIGEIGLDYHYEFASRADQRLCFERQIELASTCNLPIVIHCRNAFDDTHQLLRANLPPHFPVIMHCFSGSPTIIEQYADLDPFYAFSGILTFAKANDVLESAKLVSSDRLLVETDSPFLAPFPFRGRRNEPTLVILVAEMLAKIRNKPLLEMASLLLQNTQAAFRLHA